MITEPIVINFSYGSIDYTISIPADDNIPYNLAEAFEEVIRKSSANPEIVINELIDSFKYSPIEEE